MSPKGEQRGIEMNGHQRGGLRRPGQPQQAIYDNGNHNQRYVNTSSPSNGRRPPSRDPTTRRNSQIRRAPASESRAASALDDRNFRTPSVFDLFFDLPHPAASKDSERARMIEPPEVTNPAILSEMYEPTAISKLARFAFPEHDDHRHAIRLQSRISYVPSRKTNHSRNSLNDLDVYVLGLHSQRLTFSLLLSDGETRLYGHVLRYLPVHLGAKTRADVGRRGARAMVLLTRAAGGDRFFTGVLKSIESVLIQGDASSTVGTMADGGREKAMRFLHAICRRHAKIVSETMLKMRRSENGASGDLDDTFLSLPAIEYNVRDGNYIKDRFVAGDVVKYQLPNSLQAGFRMGSTPDDMDAPILPLLRSLGADNMVRLVAAMMCECRIILVSEHPALLSACVRGASALLAQGNLVWQYTLVPVLPPHLLSQLSFPRPFLVGLLDSCMSDGGNDINSLKEVLCVHLDRNAIKALHMTDPTKAIPDILSKEAAMSGADTLQSDMEQILKTERRLWGLTGDKATQQNAENAVNVTPEELKTGKARKPKNKAGETRIQTDIANLFGKVMRGEALHDDDESVSSSAQGSTEQARLDQNSGHLPRSPEGPYTTSNNYGTFDFCENERGEEGIRAALAMFFLLTHGELGTMLSEDTDGTILLDRKKYLMNKKRNGAKENTVMFQFYRKFSGSTMLEHYLAIRVDEFQGGKNKVMARHRSLFSLCEKHLRSKKMDFSQVNIRRVISNTAMHSPMHLHVEKTEIARARSLALTSAQAFDGDVAQVLAALMQDCHYCDSALPHSMAVIWERLDDRRPNGWKHPLLGLHLLKNLLFHGPITAISYAMDGIDKVRRLRFYSMARPENNEEVQKSAAFVWGVMVDRPRLLQRRTHVAARRANLLLPNPNDRCERYLKTKLPFPASFKDYHTLVRPKSTTLPCFMKGRGRAAGDPRGLAIFQMRFTELVEGSQRSLVHERSHGSLRTIQQSDLLRSHQDAPNRILPDPNSPGHIRTHSGNGGPSPLLHPTTGAWTHARRQSGSPKPMSPTGKLQEARRSSHGSPPPLATRRPSPIPRSPEGVKRRSPQFRSPELPQNESRRTFTNANGPSRPTAVDATRHQSVASQQPKAVPKDPHTRNTVPHGYSELSQPSRTAPKVPPTNPYQAPPQIPVSMKRRGSVNGYMSASEIHRRFGTETGRPRNPKDPESRRRQRNETTPR